MEKFEVIRSIGSGSFGCALLCREKSSGKMVVIKQTKLGALKRKEREAAQNEVRLMRLLQHPNVISVLDSFFDAGEHFCIVMEYAEHGDLQAALKKQAGRPMAEATIVKWISQLCDALVHVHARKILHRDIKSANIFLDKSDNIKLGDLGIGKALNGTNELARTVIGTPYFMSPELLLNQPYSYKSDMWAVGCLVFELCAHKPPYEARDMSGLVMKITQAPTPPLPSGYSPALNELYQALMSKAPAKRPTAAQAVVTCTMRLQGRGQLKSAPAPPAVVAVTAPAPAPAAKPFLAPPVAAHVVAPKPQLPPPASKPVPPAANHVAAPAAPWLFVGAAAAAAAGPVDPSIHRANTPAAYRPPSAVVPAVANAAAAEDNSRVSRVAELQRLQNEKNAIERRRNALEQLQQDQERLRRERSRAQVASANVYRLQQQARIAIADKLLKQPAAQVPQQRPQSANPKSCPAPAGLPARPPSAAANGVIRPPSNVGGRLSRARVNPDIMRDKQLQRQQLHERQAAAFEQLRAVALVKDLPRYPNGGKDSSEDDLSPGVGRVGSVHGHVGNGAALVQYPAAHAIASEARANVVSPLAEYDVEGSGSSGSEDSDAPFARADAAAAAAAAAGCSPSTDAVPSGDGALADEEGGEEDAEVDDGDEDEGDVEGSYSDIDGDSDPEDSAIRDEISKCANMLAQTTLQVETLRAIIEDFSDEDQGQPQAHSDHARHHDVQVAFSIAAEPHASLREPQHVVPESVSDDVSSASSREQDIISALDSCVQEMAALDPQEKLVHCATVLQVFLGASARGTVCAIFATPYNNLLQSYLGQVTFDTLLLFVKLEGQLQEVGRARVTVGAMHEQVLQAFGGSEKAAELAWNLMETLVFILESLHTV